MIRVLSTIAIFTVAACTELPDRDEDGSIAYEGPNQVTAPLEDAAMMAADIPAALHGQWREPLGRPLEPRDCTYAQGTDNFGKVIDVRADGFSRFEESARLTDVHARTDDMVEASFDTTYADTPTSARLRLSRDGDALRLATIGEDAEEAVRYLPCPAG